MTAKHLRDPTKSLVGFLVNDVQYALPVDQVREVTNPIPIVSLPHSPADVIGVAEYRGAIVTVVDLRSRFGLPRAEATRRTKWIVVETPAGVVALVVDAVTEVFGSKGRDLRPAPWFGAAEAHRVAGVTSRGGLVFVLDVSSLRELVESPALAHSIGALGPGGSGPLSERPT